MPQQKGTTTKRKPQTTKKASSSATKSAAAKQREAAQKKVNAQKQMAAVILFVAAIFIGCLVFVEGSNIWQVLHEFMFGLFGAIAYVVPFIVAAVAILLSADKKSMSVTAKMWQALALLVMLCGAVQIFGAGSPTGDGFAQQFASMYADGVDRMGGGIFGALLGWPLFELFGKTGAGITIILLIVLFVMILTGITLVDVFKTVTTPVKKLGNVYQERYEEKEIEKERRFNIDIPLGPDEDEMPNHPVTAGQVIWSTVNMTDKEKKALEKQKAKEEKKNKANEIAEIKRRKEQESSKQIPAQTANTAPAPAKPAPAIDDIVKRFAPEPEKPQETAPQPVKLTKNELVNETMEIEKDIASTEAENAGYVYPPITLLEEGIRQNTTDVNELKQNAELLVDTLKSFGVHTKILDISRGPTVTRYELQPSAGVKISKITNLADDIALNLASAGVRIEAPIPNKAAVGIEVPNKEISIVKLRSIIDSNEFVNAKSKLSVALGKDLTGENTIADLAKMPHILVAGATGSGKSVCINSIIISLLYKSTPDEVRFLMVDPKVVELGIYNGIPHLLVPVVTDARKAAGALNWAVTEMLNRYKLFADNQVRDLEGYNDLARINDEIKPLPQIVIIIDELADLMIAAPNEVEDAICRLAQMARAAGMHLVIATQRPSVDVITGVIKANIPSRIAFSVSSQVDSRTILDMGGAEKLLGRGDMLYYPMGKSKPIRVQGCYVNDKEVEHVVTFIKEGKVAAYDETILDEIEKQAVKEKGASSSAQGGGESDSDEMLPKAIECVVEAGQASTSLLQRKLKLGYARAARIIDEMEERGIVGPFEGSKPRQVLITRQQWIEMTMAQDNPPQTEE